MNIVRAIKPIEQSREIDASHSAPVGYRHALPIMDENSVVALIAALFHRSSPSAILGIVASIIIDSVKRVMLAWGFPHISKKVLKVTPALAYCDPSSCITGEGVMVWIGASLPHHLPDGELSSSGFPMLADLLFVKASAGNLRSGPERVTENGYNLPAVAQALPARDFALVFPSWRSGFDGKSSKSFADKINDGRHKTLQWFVDTLNSITNTSTNVVR